MGVREDGVVCNLVDISSDLIFFFTVSLLLTIYLIFFVKCVGLMPITNSNTSKRSLSPEYMVSGVIFRMGMIPV